MYKYGILEEQEEVIGCSVSAACVKTVERVLVVRISRCHVGQREERAFRLPVEG